MFSKERLERMIDSLIMDVDSYKAGQWLQYPALTQFIESYISSRGGKYPYIVVSGLQRYAKNYLSRVVTQQDIEDAALFWKAHGEPFNRAGWEYIVNKHGGRLPLKIMAVREGTVVPVHNAILKVINTDKENCGWLTSYVETALLRAIWYPTTVATVACSIKDVIRKFLIKTSDNLDNLDYKLIDFGSRGVSSKESSAIGGMGHQIFFKGTDNVISILDTMYYYNEEEVISHSIPASEHSTITSWMRKGEKEAYRNMLEQFGGKYPMFACVIDSYNPFEAADMWADMKDDIIQLGSMVVIRPDSGNPAEVVTKLILLLDSKFGHTMNSKGYRVLNHVRILQGDGIEEESINEILTSVMGYGFSAENISFGMGGALLQKIDRDTQRFAMKASAGFIGGKWVDIYKDPITDQGKRSMRGRLMLIKNETTNEYATVTEGSPQVADWKDALEVMWQDGDLLIDEKFTDIRERAEKSYAAYAI